MLRCVVFVLRLDIAHVTTKYADEISVISNDNAKQTSVYLKQSTITQYSDTAAS